MSFNQQHLTSLLTRIKDIPDYVLQTLLLDAQLTEYDLSVLIGHSTDLENQFLEDLPIDVYLEKCPDQAKDALISSIAAIKDLDAEQINNAIDSAGYEDKLITLDLFDFSQLSKQAQKFAMAQTKKSFNSGRDKSEHWTNKTAFDYLMMSHKRFLITGYEIDREELEL